MRRVVILSTAFLSTTIFFLTVRATAQTTEDATLLVKGALVKQKGRPFWFHLRSITFGYVPYVFNVEARVVKYDGHGNAKSDRDCSTTGVFVPVEETLLYTPIEFCGEPVAVRTREYWEHQREEKLSEAKRRSAAEKAKIQSEEERRRKERALFWDEFVKAFRFQILDHRIQNGQPTTVVAFNPIPNYRPGAAIDTKYLPKLRGQLWIDDSDNEIARLEMEFMDDVSMGFGMLGKVSAGSTYVMELAKQIDDSWLPAKAETVLRMRQLLVIKTNQKYTYRYSSYRKFSTDVLLREKNAQIP
jgi:hypothetical protein